MRDYPTNTKRKYRKHFRSRVREILDEMVEAVQNGEDIEVVKKAAEEALRYA